MTKHRILWKVLAVLILLAGLGGFFLWEGSPEVIDDISEDIQKNIMPYIRHIDLVHADYVDYVVDENGNWQATEINGIVYMNQTDRRWGREEINGYTVAESGCSPSIGAMLVNLFLNTEYTPYDIGLQFHQWGYMNIVWPGSMPQVWKRLAEENHFRFYQNVSDEEVKTALKNGWIIVASVQGPPFTREVTNLDDWVSHTVMVYGLNADNETNVLDPYYEENCRVFDLEEFMDTLVKQYRSFGNGAVRIYAPGRN